MRRLCYTASASLIALALGTAAPMAQTAQSQNDASRQPAGASRNGNQQLEQQIRAAVDEANVRRTSIDISVLRQGSILPPTVDLSPIPDRVAQLAPTFRGHSVVRASDRLYIVEPRTRRIAEIIQFDRPDQQAADRRSPGQTAQTGQNMRGGQQQSPAQNQQAAQQNQAQGQQNQPVAAVAVVFIPVQQREHWLASRLMDRTVYNLQNESIGDVQDIIVGGDGRVQGLVIGVGGFLGLGEKDVAVPFDRFELQPSPGMWSDANARLVLRTTRDDLTNAPTFRRRDDQATARNTSGDASVERTSERATPSRPSTTTQGR